MVSTTKHQQFTTEGGGGGGEVAIGRIFASPGRSRHSCSQKSFIEGPATFGYTNWSSKKLPKQSHLKLDLA